MAAFTSLALMAGGLAAGKMLGKIGKKKPGETAPVTAPAPLAPTAPTPPVLNPSWDVLKAQQAGVRQRKKAKPAAVPAPSLLSAKPAVMPKSLLGY